MHSQGYKYKNLQKKPKLTEQHKINRLEWAKAHKNFNFQSVIFTDETGIWLAPNAQRGWVKKGQIKIFEREAHPAKVSAIAGIGVYGKVFLTTYTTNMNSSVYIDITRNHLIPAANRLYAGSGWLLMRDLAGWHRSGVTMDFYEESQIELFDFPSNSPDVNSIENVWSLLKRNIYKRHIENSDDLEQAINEEWEALSNELVIRIFNSIYDRVDALISSKGSVIKY